MPAERVAPCPAEVAEVVAVDGVFCPGEPDDSVAVVQLEDLPTGWVDRVNAYLHEHGFDVSGHFRGN